MDVPLSELADRLGVHPTVAAKFARKIGIDPVRKQMLALGHHQMTLTWTTEQVADIMAERRRRGFEVRP